MLTTLIHVQHTTVILLRNWNLSCFLEVVVCNVLNHVAQPNVWLMSSMGSNSRLHMYTVIRVNRHAIGDNIFKNGLKVDSHPLSFKLNSDSLFLSSKTLTLFPNY